MKIATVQYSWDKIKDWDQFVLKNRTIVEGAKGAEIILFPEYAHGELMYLGNIEELLPRYLAFFAELARKAKAFICTGTYIVREGDKFHNRAFLFGPNGGVEFQNKLQLTPDERQEVYLEGGSELKVFGNIAIAVCYDSEFPMIVRTQVAAGAEIILVPAYTNTMSGFYRVHLSCRARALENQCYVVHSSMVGKTDTDTTFGYSGIYTPVDEGFPEDGILANGRLNIPETVVANVDPSLLATVRKEGQTRNYFDWNATLPGQAKRVDCSSL